MAEDAITIDGRYYRCFPAGAHLGHAYEELTLPLAETVFLVIDVYNAGFDEGAETEAESRNPNFQRYKRVVREHLVPALEAARQKGRGWCI